MTGRLALLILLLASLAATACVRPEEPQPAATGARTGGPGGEALFIPPAGPLKPARDPERIRQLASRLQVAGGPQTPAADGGTVLPARPPRDDDARYRMPLGAGLPSRGADKPLVFATLFLDYECPHSRRAAPLLLGLIDAFPDTLRLYVRQNPIHHHKQALTAARAALAAHRQGRFWEMQAELFARGDRLGEPALREAAAAAGLDLARFDQDRTDPAIERQIEEDLALTRRFRTGATPALFVNGTRYVGVRTAAEYRRYVERELERARTLATPGLTSERLYAELVRDGLEERPAASRDDSRAEIEAGDSPVRGPAGAPVTIVMFSDFECPFCRKGAGAIRQTLERHPTEVRLVFKHNPMPGHPGAEAAALGALAAGRQGRFWEMHDLLFEHAKELSPAVVERLAQELDLDLERFRRDVADPGLLVRLRTDQRQAASLKAFGTPAFFVNGALVMGYRPAEEFSRMIAEELAGKPR